MSEANAVIACAWEQVWQCRAPGNDVERVLFTHLVDLTSSSYGEEDASDDAQRWLDHLDQEIRSKRTYMDPSWGYIEAAAIGQYCMHSCAYRLAIRC